MDLDIHDKELFDAIFGNFNNDSNISPSFKLNVILDISQPMLFELDCNNKKYLIYVLQDRSKIVKDKLAIIQELLFSEVNSKIVAQLIKSEISIHDSFLTSNKTWRVGKIANKIFPREMLENYNEIQDRFPIKDVTLKDVPNKTRY